jgi:hypothetical protein
LKVANGNEPKRCAQYGLGNMGVLGSVELRRRIPTTLSNAASWHTYKGKFTRRIVERYICTRLHTGCGRPEMMCSREACRGRQVETCTGCGARNW